MVTHDCYMVIYSYPPQETTTTKRIHTVIFYPFATQIHFPFQVLYTELNTSLMIQQFNFILLFDLFLSNLWFSL